MTATGWDELDLGALREGLDFEAKQAQGRIGRGEIPASFGDTYSAMANTHGGVIALGVKERSDGSFQVLGIVDKAKILRELWNQVTNPQKISENLLTKQDVVWKRDGTKEYLLVRVRAATREERPVYINGNPLTGTYIRVGDGDRRLEKSRVKRMLADRGDVTDSKIVHGLSLEAINFQTVDHYARQFRLVQPDHPFLRRKAEEFLRGLEAARPDPESGDFGPTVAGLLAFGREEAIREIFPHFMLDFRHTDADPDPVQGRWIDRVCNDGTWAGNVYTFFTLVMPRLREGLKVPFQLERDLRTDASPVYTALREALVNSLVHADYWERGGVRVVREVDRFSFENPGRLLVPYDRLFEGGRSECRNPALQKIFRLAGMGEQAGSGIPAIVGAWRGQSWRRPLIRDDLESNQTILILPMLSLFPEDVVDSLRRQFGVEFDHLGEDERLALVLAKHDGQVTNQGLQDQCLTHPRDLTDKLRVLVKGGFLESHGQTRARYYTVPAPKAPKEGSSDADVNYTLNFNDDSELETDTAQQEGEPLDLRRGARHPDRNALIGQLPANLRDRVQSLKQKVPAHEMESLVLSLCALRPMTPGDLAAITGRRVKYLSGRILGPLVTSGRLRRLYPDNPTHPDQAYLAER